MHVTESPVSPVPATIEQQPTRALALRSVRDLYYVLFRHGRQVFLAFAGTFLLVGMFVLVQPPSYRSEARLMVRIGRKLDPTVTMGKTVGVQQSRLEEINSELEILTSHDLLMEVVAATFGKMKESALQDAAHELRKRLVIEVQEESNVICLAYTHDDRQTAQAVVAQLIQRYLAKHIAVHRTEGSYEFFLAQSQQAAEKIAHYEGQVRDLRKETGVASIEDERRTLIERMGARESALEELRTQLAAARGRVTEDPVLMRLREKLNELRVNELELLAHYEESSTAVQDLRLQVSEVTRLLAQQEAQGLEQSTASITAQIRTVEEQITGLRQRLGALDDAEVAITGVALELALERESYQRYSESLEQARIDQALNAEKISNIGIVQPATLPAQSSGPSRMILLTLALLLACACALFTAFVLEYFDDSIDTPERAEARLTLPVLAAIPEEHAIGRAKGPDLALVHAELSELSEQLREWSEQRRHPFGASNGTHSKHLAPGLLRLHRGELGGAPAVLAITSCTPGSGVSTVASGLATRLAKTGLKTMLVSGETTGERTLSSRNGTNGRRNSVVHLGMDLSGLRNGAQMDAVIWQLRAKGSDFAFVVVDLPDLASSRIAAPIAALCDGALLVVGANKTRWQVAMHAKERLLEARTNLLGTVVNRRVYPIPQWLYETL